MKSKSIKGKSPEEIRTALAESMIDGFKPTVAIVFLSIRQDIDTVCRLLTENDIHVFGSTTSGEFISSEVSEGGIAIMLLDLNPEYFKILFLETNDNGVYETAKQLGENAKKLFTNAAFILTSGWTNIDGEQIIRGIEDGYNGEPTIFGGMAGDDLTLAGPRVFNNKKNSTTGIVALIVDEEKVNVNGVATCGWKPIGITKTVTKSQGNIVYTLDDKPAFDLVIKYLGLNTDDMAVVTETIVNIGAYYPLQLEREDAPPVMRTAQLGNLEDRSLICAGNVPQGSKIRFSLPPDFDVIDIVVEECNSVRKSSGYDTDAVIMFSCISRYASFGALIGEEIERVQQLWNAPFIGFFSYGEYGKSKRGKHEFHNNTCCVVALKEK